MHQTKQSRKKTSEELPLILLITKTTSNFRIGIAQVRDQTAVNLTYDLLHIYGKVHVGMIR